MVLMELPKIKSNFSDVSESQPIDINSINLNKHVPNDLAQQEITNDTSLTSTHVSDQDTNKVDNNSDANESQSIDINSINLNNHTSNDCESPSGSDSI